MWEGVLWCCMIAAAALSLPTEPSDDMLSIMMRFAVFTASSALHYIGGIQLMINDVLPLILIEMFSELWK